MKSKGKVVNSFVKNSSIPNTFKNGNKTKASLKGGSCK